MAHRAATEGGTILTPTAGTATNGEISIAYETFGTAGNPALLLIMGHGAPMVYWPTDFCLALAERGFHVARFDNRDTGRSTHLDGARAPSLVSVLASPRRAAVYLLEDMASDAVAVLDALDWPTAHVAGVSMGGMIAQTMAITNPDRVASLTSISSTPHYGIGRQTLGTTLRRLAARIEPDRTEHDRAERSARYMLRVRRAVSSPGYAFDEDWLRELSRQVDACGGRDPAGKRRQTAAILAAPDRRPALRRLGVPALVLHGEADTMIRPIGGTETARAIPGARLRLFPGMGHDLPRELWPEFIAEISRTSSVDAGSPAGSVDGSADDYADGSPSGK